MTSSTARYLRVLSGGRKPARIAASALADVVAPESPRRDRVRTAVLTVAAASALLPCALARHMHRRGGAVSAAWDVVTKFGRPEDLDAPDIGVRAQWERSRPDPRLGGLLADSADEISAWLATGHGATPAECGRALAAVAPLVLGAVARAAESATGLESLLAGFPPEGLEHVARLDGRADASGDVFRAVRSASSGAPWLRWFAFRFRS